MTIIDAQLHEPALARDWSTVDRDARFELMLEVELAYMDAVGVDKAVIFAIEDAWGAWVCDRRPDRFAFVTMITPPGVTGGVAVDDPGFADLVEACAANPACVGLRMMHTLPGRLFAGGGDDAPPWVSDVDMYEPLFQACLAHGLPMFMSTAGALDGPAEVVRRHPDLVLIVDAPDNALDVDDDGFAWIARARPLSVVVVGEHTEWLRRLVSGDPDVRALFARHGMAAEHLASLAARGNHYHRGVPEAPHAFSRLIDGDTVTLGDRPWRVIAGYGHSPEHAALAAGDAKLLIAGDMLLPRISTNVAVWPSEPDGDPVQRFLDSLAAFEALPPDTLVLPSHGTPFRGIGARVSQLRAHHAARLDELQRFLAAAGAPQSAHDAIPVLFRRELDVHQRFFAIGEAIAHLNHLWRHERATRRIGDDGAIRFTA